MNLPFCSQEEKIAELAKTGNWPQAADPDLAAHAGKCSRCNEALFAIQMLQRLRASDVKRAHIGSPTALWWRAQLRQRNGAMEQIAKPLVWAEIVAFIGMLVIAAAIFFQQWTPINRWLNSAKTTGENQILYTALNWFSTIDGGSLTSFVMLAGIAGVAAIVCVGGLTLFLSDKSR
jgi:hypothetical protein